MESEHRNIFHNEKPNSRAKQSKIHTISMKADLVKTGVKHFAIECGREVIATKEFNMWPAGAEEELEAWKREVIDNHVCDGSE